MEPEEVRQLRRTLGLSQTQLGNQLDVSQALVSLWENGGPIDARHEAAMQALAAAEPAVDPDRDTDEDEDEDLDGGGNAFGEWLLRERTAQVLTRARLSDLAGVSPAQIYNIETGRTPNPRPETRARLEEALQSEVPEEVSSAAAEEAEIEDVGQFEYFDPHDDDSLPREPGIYVFYDSGDHVIYIGEAGDVRRRISQNHIEKFWYHPRLITTAAFVRVEDERLRKQIERTMIKFLRSNAVLNRNHVERD